jgi:photosystem II stability/assembly factor-like uncharacterized protein
MGRVEGVVMKTTTFLSLLSVTFCVIAPAQVNVGTLQAMKLLTADVGWAATRNRLFWTNNAGTEWKDITPKTSVPEEIDSAFFLNSVTGWILFSRYDNDNDTRRFEIASTTTGGSSWVVTAVKISNLAQSTSLAGGGHVFFVDSKRGWLNLPRVSSTAAHTGILLATQDGGLTWTWPGQPGTAGLIRFVTTLDGWVVSTPFDDLAVTHDGAKSWQRVLFQSPPQAKLSDNAMPTYDLPVFADGKQGFMLTGYADGDSGALVLYASRDNGKNWTQEKILPDLEEAAVVIVDTSWIAASITNKQRTLILTRAGISGGSVDRVSADVSNISGLHGVGGLLGSEELSFTDTKHGWILAGQLLSTSDGGASWADITPFQAKIFPLGKKSSCRESRPLLTHRSAPTGRFQVAPYPYPLP